MPVPTRMVVLVAALVAGAGSGGVAGAQPAPPGGDRLDRGAALALPSVFRVEARYEIDGLRVGNGRVITIPAGAGRVIREVGTAFAVSPDGILVTAAHVAAPDGAALARAAAPVALAGRFEGRRPPDADYIAQWVELNDVHAVRPRLTELRVVQATAEAGRPTVRFPATIVPGSRSAVDDLVLLRIPRRGVPALELEESMTTGTPVATIGFGAEDPLAPGDGAAVPVVRPARLGATGRVPSVPGQRFTVVTAPVERGDSGGPAVDVAGRVHGVVRWRFRGQGILVRATRVRMLLERAGVTGGEGPSGTAFRSGLERLWRADLAGAAGELRTARAAYPEHALAAFELTRVDRLRTDGPGARATGWGRDLWLGLATAFALAAAACIAGAVPRRARRVPPGGRAPDLEASRPRG